MNPARFAEYTLLRRIATGGTAEIFLARRHGVDGFVRHLAIKRILPHLVDDPNFVQLLLDEARLAAHLHHGHIIEIHQVGLAGGNEAYIAMEYLPGIDLGRLVKKARRRVRRVLVVADDAHRDALVAAVLGLSLGGGGLTVSVARDGAEALARSAEGHLDLVICAADRLGPTRDPWLESVQAAHPELMRTLILGGGADGRRGGGRGHGACALHLPDIHLPPGIEDLADLQAAATACLRPVLPIELALQVVRAVVDALDYAHTARDFEGEPLEVVHRDVNPSNVLVSVGGAVKLVDFGIARARTSLREERKGNLVGTYAYMSPEQAAGREAGPRSDLFCVGTLLYELLAGVHPFQGDSEFSTLRAVREDEPVPLDQWVPGLPPALAAATARALSKRPEARQPDAATLLRDLEAVLRADGLDLNPKRLAGFLRVVYEPSELEAFGVNDTGYGTGEATAPEREVPLGAVRPGEDSWPADVVPVPPPPRAPGSPIPGSPTPDPAAPGSPAPDVAPPTPAPRPPPAPARQWPPVAPEPPRPPSRGPYLLWVALLLTTGLAVAGWLQYARAIGAF